MITLTDKEFVNFLVSKGAKIYNNYGMLARNYYLHLLPKNPED